MRQRRGSSNQRSNSVLEALKVIVEDLAKAIGPDCEVVLHDLSNPQSSIIAIAGDVTGRQVGGPATDLLLQLLHKGHTDKNLINYRTRTSNGKMLRSSTLFLKDEEGEVIGSLCINYDITYLVQFKRWLDNFCKINDVDSAKDGSVETFAQDIEDILHTAINQVITSVGVPIPSMQKEDRVKAVKILDEMGIFMIKNSINYVAKQLNVSRYTIYNYLNEIKTPKSPYIHQNLERRKG